MQTAAAQRPAPFVAAVKRGPFTLTQPVYNNAEEPETEHKMHSHTFNINIKALKNNHKYHKRIIPAPVSKKSVPRIKSRSHLAVNEKRDLYKQHRDRLANIKGKVNTCLPPPKQPVKEGSGMELSYMEMLAALYRKSNDTLRTFTKSPDRLAAGRWRNTSVAREKERKQQEKNKKYHVGGGLFDPHAGKTRRNKVKAPKSFSYEVPLHVLHRYEDLMSVCDVQVLCKLLRPQIFMDFEVTGTRIMGRLAIQLFTEACPEVVLEFMRVCTTGNPHLICFTRTFAPIWLEGKIALDPQRKLDMSNIEHDFEVLNHGVDAGILSFPSRYVRGNSSRTSLNFSISFKPLSILNGKRIAFGKVRKGLQLLERIHEATAHLPSNNGVVKLTGCGIL
ncbi:CG3492 [Drosophila busckii]|uniref:CG3492 n=2 Tax=Drosophila busckii TaxID=30019 RepID=A0A0M4EA51_DROBS|nr:CG3492 [Drosophila busckii]